MRAFNFLNIIFIVCMFFTSGCQSPTEPHQIDPLYGNWLLKVVSGGFAGIVDTLDTSKERNILSFLNENTAIFSHNDSILWQRNYHIEKRKSIYSLDSLRFIIYENKPLHPRVITYLNNDTLNLADNMYDGYGQMYVRIYNSGNFSK